MSTQVKHASKSAAKPSPKAKASAPSKAPAKAAAAANGAGKAPAAAKKGGKAAAKAEADGSEASMEGQPPAVDPDEAEEAADEAAAANGGGGNAAAVAAASGPGEMSASFKNFRHHPDMENFYRFIYENDLRHEALAIIDVIIAEKRARKLAGKSAH